MTRVCPRSTAAQHINWKTATRCALIRATTPTSGPVSINLPVSSSRADVWTDCFKRANGNGRCTPAQEAEYLSMKSLQIITQVYLADRIYRSSVWSHVCRENWLYLRVAVKTLGLPSPSECSPLTQRCTIHFLLPVYSLLSVKCNRAIDNVLVRRFHDDWILRDHLAVCI